mmetsp:Transcript_22005/g.56165  ORF Transcript_22005/g.56165 Transcript_22005/m.56165 type:complete len:224 (-) Transcript_22005:436-1107(-)
MPYVSVRKRTSLMGNAGRSTLACAHTTIHHRPHRISQSNPHHTLERGRWHGSAATRRTGTRTSRATLFTPRGPCSETRRALEYDCARAVPGSCQDRARRASQPSGLEDLFTAKVHVPFAALRVSSTIAATTTVAPTSQRACFLASLSASRFILVGLTVGMASGASAPSIRCAFESFLEPPDVFAGARIAASRASSSRKMRTDVITGSSSLSPLKMLRTCTSST